MVSFVCMVAGVLIIALGINLAPVPTPVSAGPMLQPSPRPPLPEDRDRPEPTPVPPGAITGTVIDLTTGAPASGVDVNIEGVIVTTDSNGNYERNNLPVGVYTVNLELDGRGTPAQRALQIEVGAGDRVVVHLFFYSQLTPTPLPPTATAMPVMPPTNTAVPPPPSGGQIPPELPETSGNRLPSTLPVTAGGSYGSPLPVIALGSLLLVFGLTLQIWPHWQRRRVAAAQQSADEEMLEDMLAKDL
jgi:hypothetical protein